MHHPKILEKFGLTQHRLREIFTAAPETKDDKGVNIGAIRKKFEERIKDRIDQGVRTCAQNATLWQAVDMAWDSPPIQKETIPLLLWAQGKIKKEALHSRLEGTPLAEELIKKKENGTISIDMPRLYEMSITLLRSYVTRRLAAQTSRFANLWPYFRYEPRGVDMVSKLKADVLSQRIDIMVDSYNIRHLGTQLARDQLMYARSIAFPRCKWDCVKGWRAKDLNVESANVELESYVVREGIEFINPHPSRVYWDLSAPLPNINTDTGPAWIGHWGIVKYGELLNGKYWNTDRVSSGDSWASLVSRFQDFFAYYFDPTIIQQMGARTDPTIANNREANIGVYASTDKDRGCLLVQHFEKVNPKHESICDYDCDIWLRLVVAGDGTVVGAEPMPSIPACYGGMNENDQRVVSMSMAMELLAYQDQLSNLASHMLGQLRLGLLQLWIIDKDSLEPKIREYFENGMKRKDFWVDPQALFYSSSKLRELGINDPSQAFKVVQANLTNTIENCFNGITRLLNLCDRLLILSPNELGQPAPREISATEVQEISNTTTSIHTFVADGIDEQRAAMKKLLYESLVTQSTSTLRVPALNRYSVETLTKAGFKLEDTTNLDDGKIIPIQTPIVGDIRTLIYEYVFDSRDGAERTPNSAVAQTITQLVQFLTSNEVVARAMGKRRLFELVNEAVRLSGSGVDFKLSMDEGEDGSIGEAELEQVVQQLTAAVQQLNDRLTQIDGGGASASSPTAGGGSRDQSAGLALPPAAQPALPAPPSAVSNAAVLGLGANP